MVAGPGGLSRRCCPRPGRGPSRPARVSGTAVWGAVDDTGQKGRVAKAGRGRRWRRPLGWRPSSLGKQAPGAPRERPGGRDRRREPWRPERVRRRAVSGAPRSYASNTLRSRVTGPARSPQTLSVCCVTVAARARRGFEPHGAARGSFEGTGPLRSCGLLTCVCDTRRRTPPQPARPRVPLAVLLQRKGGVRRTGAWLRASLCGGKRVPPTRPPGGASPGALGPPLLLQKAAPRSGEPSGRCGDSRSTTLTGLGN